MTGYIEKLLQRMKHEKPTKPQHSPYQDPPRIFGTDSQNTILPDALPKLDDKRKRKVQQVIGGDIYYACAIDITVLPALGTIVCEQSQATEMTKKKVSQLLNYLATKPNTKVQFYASGMVLNIHSDASYLSEPRSHSRVSGDFFLGDTPVKGQPVVLNGAFYLFTGF